MHQGADVNPPNALFLASAVGSKLFFSKMLTYKSFLGVKIVPTAPIQGYNSGNGKIYAIPHNEALVGV